MPRYCHRAKKLPKGPETYARYQPASFLPADQSSFRVQMAHPPTKDQQAHTCQSRRQEEPYGAYAVWRKGNLRESIGTRNHEMEGTSSLTYSLVK